MGALVVEQAEGKMYFYPSLLFLCRVLYVAMDVHWTTRLISSIFRLGEAFTDRQSAAVKNEKGRIQDFGQITLVIMDGTNLTHWR